MSSDELPTMWVLSSGKYEMVTACLFAGGEADAVRAAEVLNDDDPDGFFVAEEVPVIPAGQVPQRVTVHSACVATAHHVWRRGRAGEPYLITGSVRQWRWKAPDGVLEFPAGTFTGTDREAVLDAANALLQQQRLAHAEELLEHGRAQARALIEYEAQPEPRSGR